MDLTKEAVERAMRQPHWLETPREERFEDLQTLQGLVRRLAGDLRNLRDKAFSYQAVSSERFIDTDYDRSYALALTDAELTTALLFTSNQTLSLLPTPEGDSDE